MDQAERALFLKMAQQAAKDPGLLAAHIASAARKEAGGWSAVARSLNMDEIGLAKLALCGRPAAPHFDADVPQIASLVNVDAQALARFLQEPLPGPSRVKPASPNTPQKNPSYRRLVWASALLLVVGLLFGTFVLASAQDSLATLVVQQGQVTLIKGNSLAAWFTPPESVVPAGQIQTVKAGDQVFLPGGAAAELRFYDGSSAALGENAHLVVQELVTSQAGYRVRLKQLSGATFNRVIRLLGAGDSFEINTPSSTVSVRGTEFIVAVLAPDQSWIAVNKGVVQVVMGDQAVDVHPGEQLLARLGQPLQVQPQAGPQPQLPASPSVLPTAAPLAPPTSGSPAATRPPASSAPTQAAPAQGTPAGNTPVSTPGAGDGGAAPSQAAPVTSPGASTGTNSEATPNGSVKQVPGKPPSDPPGNGSPPTGGAEPPGQAKEKNNPSDKTDKGSGKNKTK